MFRKFIAIITICVINFLFLVNPVRAESIPNNNFHRNNRVAHNSVLNNPDIWSDPFVKSLSDNAKITAGTAIGEAIVCYSIDGIATVAFPPAAALSPFCSAIGAVGGGSAIVKGVKPAKYLLRNAL